MIRSIRTFPILVLAAFTLMACGSEVPETETPAEVSAVPAAADIQPAVDAAQAETEFEPAYPEEVSSEDLTAADTEQQKDASAGHTHADGTTHANHPDEAAPDPGDSEKDPPRDPPAEKEEGGEGSGG